MPGIAAFRSSVEEHAAHVRALLAPLADRATETVPLEDALGRATAAAVTSPVALPLFRNSQMDGYAVRAADLAGATAASPVALPVVGEIAAAAGSPAPLEPGTVARIMTGAPVPDGADAVVRVEDTDAGGGARGDTGGAAGGAAGTDTEVDRVAIPHAPAAGEYVREAGSDLAAGAVLVPAGLRLRSRHLAALAAAGLAHVAVRERVRLAIVSTGSELVAPGADAGPGELFDANGPALVAAARECGAEVVLSGRVRDDPGELRELLDAAVAAGAEAIVTSGGVSMGEHEVVRELLEPLGARVGSVAMQPGGPQGTAVWPAAAGRVAPPAAAGRAAPQACVETPRVPVLCFPGNPVSSQLSFELFLAPLLRELAGLPAARWARERLAHPVSSVAGKRQFLRGARTADGIATVAGPGSHLVAALAAATLLVVVPEEVAHLDAGEIVETVEL